MDSSCQPESAERRLLGDQLGVQLADSIVSIIVFA
jgi:hypothetical protein